MAKFVFDMDGTLNVFEPIGPDELAKPGFMKNRQPFDNMLDAARILHEDGHEIWIASAVMPYEHVISDKNYWLDQHMPYIPKERRIFIPYGQSKYDALHTFMQESDVFVDDYSDNLHGLVRRFTPGSSWICVKCINGINDTNHSWNGARISVWTKGQIIADTLKGLSYFGQKSA